MQLSDGTVIEFKGQAQGTTVRFAAPREEAPRSFRVPGGEGRFSQPAGAVIVREDLVLGMARLEQIVAVASQSTFGRPAVVTATDLATVRMLNSARAVAVTPVEVRGGSFALQIKAFS